MPAQRATRRASGPHDAITDVAGIRVGHWTHRRWATGCTVVICAAGAVGGVDVRGAAPGTRETDLLRPGNLVEEIHAIVLSGGSAFGLDSAGGVVRHLEERGIGLHFAGRTIPIVPAAILFDLGLGNGARRPGAEEGERAARRATSRTRRAGLGGRRHGRDRRLAAGRRARAQGRARQRQRAARERRDRRRDRRRQLIRRDSRPERRIARRRPARRRQRLRRP